MMKKEEALCLLRGGEEGIRVWNERRKGGDKIPALSGADLSGVDLSGADLSGVDLNGVDLNGAKLEKANLSGANLRGVDLSWAVVSWANLARANLSQACLEQADLIGTVLTEALLTETVLKYAKLSWANLARANLSQACLEQADLTRANLDEANLNRADLTRATIPAATFFGATIEGSIFAHVKGAMSAIHLESTKVEKEVNSFDSCERAWPERFCSWENLRTFGNLPLFGISYASLLFIPLYVYLLAWYNKIVVLIEGWAKKVEDQGAKIPVNEIRSLAITIQDRLDPEPVSRWLLLAFISTLFLAIASTIYRLGAPARIQEFSSTRWEDELGKPLIHYWSLAWKWRYVRLCCGVCYVLGGVLAIMVIGRKVWSSFWFLWENTYWQRSL